MFKIMNQTYEGFECQFCQNSNDERLQNDIKLSS